MKKYLFCLTIVTFSVFINAQAKIIGNFTSMKDYSDTIYLLAINHYKQVFANTNEESTATAIADSDGNFEFDIKSLPCTECLYRIVVVPKGIPGQIMMFGTSKENFVLFELKNNHTIKISGDATQLTKSYAITSDTPSWSFETLRKLREPVYIIADDMISFMSNADNLKGKNMDSVRASYMNQLEESFVKNNAVILHKMESSPNLYDKIIGAIIYDYDGKMDNDTSVYELMINQLEANYSLHPYLRQLKEDIADVKYILPNGSIAPKLSLANTEGKIIPLDEVGENLILVDFWASWCSPCRLENKVTVGPLYEEYKDRGFKVYSVSMDDKKALWQSAIEKDKMSWINVSDLKGMQSPVYSTYKINGLPTTYLIDADGFKIVSKNLRGEDLKKFVKNYYTK